MAIVDTGGSGHKLTQDVDDIGNVRMSDAEIDKTTDKVTRASGILKRNTVYGTKASVEPHGSFHSMVISETHTIKKIMDVLSLGEIVAVGCGCNLNPKKVTKMIQVGHMKLLTKTGLNKSNILIIISHNEHIINIKKNKGMSMGEV
jgi:hypothetical protein